tara:strand:+ start:2905 stop:3309 length:405 start_codon:yes stop_codon:yes gene_type:complete
MENLNIRQFKLVNGETIIALVNSDNQSNYLVERPVIVYSNMMGGYQFHDWFPFSPQKIFTIQKGNIVGDVSLMDDIKATYVKFALAPRPIPPIKTEEEAMENLTKTIMDRLNIESDEYEEFTEDELNTAKETIH